MKHEISEELLEEIRQILSDRQFIYDGEEQFNDEEVQKVLEKLAAELPKQ